MKDLNLVSQKAQKLSAKMNALTEKLNQNCDTSEQMMLIGDDLIDDGKDTIKDVQLKEPDLPELVNINKLMEDFEYIRASLKENTDNGRKVSNLITSILLDSDTELDNSLIAVYAKLNSSISDSMKLFVEAYKEISGIIINLEKVRTGKLNTQNNTLNVNVKTDKSIVKSTAELIEELKKGKLDA